MGRRGENIRKRTDGRWEARIVRGLPIGGKTNYKYLYGKTYQDVRRKKTEFLKLSSSEDREKASLATSDSTETIAISEGGRPFDNGNVLFCDVVLKWQASKKSGVKESTYAYYNTMAQGHLLTELGKLPISEITDHQLEEFFSRMRTQGNRRTGGALSDKTIFDLKTMLRQIFRYAHTNGFVQAIPTFPVVTSPHSSNNVLTKQEQEQVENIALDEDTPETLGILLSLYGGPRIGEVCGLQWKDFDDKNGTVSIERTIARISDVNGVDSHKTKVVIGPPKTDCSIRTIPLPEPVYQYFMDRRKDDNDYLITGNEKYMEPRVYQDHFKKIINRAGISNRTFHTLRHTFATRCVENDVDIKSLSEIMGHSDVKITMQRYVHPSMDTKKEQVNKLPCFCVSSQNRGQAFANKPEI